MKWRFADHDVNNMVGIYLHELEALWSPHEWLNQLAPYETNRIRIWVVNFNIHWKYHYHYTGDHVHFGYASVPLGYDVLYANDILPEGQTQWLRGGTTWYGRRRNDGFDLYKLIKKVGSFTISKDAIVYVDRTDPFVPDLLHKLDVMRQIVADAEYRGERPLCNELLQRLKHRLITLTTPIPPIQPIHDSERIRFAEETEQDRTHMRTAAFKEELSWKVR